MMRICKLVPSFVSLGLATACGSDAPTNEDYDDIASSVAAVVADGPGSEVEATEDAMATAEGTVPPGMTRGAEGAFNGRRGGLDYAFEVTCSDLQGVPQEACNADTETAQLVLTWDGTIETARRSATLARSGAWTLTGLTGEVAELNGSGRFDLASEFAALNRPVNRTFLFDYDASYQGVEIRRSDRRPIGGAMTYQVRAERTESRRFREIEASFDVVAEVQFAPDARATISLDGERTYNVNLETGDLELQ